MENASKALIMAAGILIGILIITLGVYLFVSFGVQSKELYKEIESNQLTQYNAQYSIYDGRTDITIYDIITLTNKAKQNNHDYSGYTDFESLYKVTVSLSGVGTDSNPALQDINTNKQNELINKYNEVNDNTGGLNTTFKCIRHNIP